MKQFLFWFAALGWTLGLIVHLLSIAGIDVIEKIPFIWVLHFGIFIVWVPAIFLSRKNEDLGEFEKSSFLKRRNPFGFPKSILQNTPSWLLTLAGVGFLYAIVNFILFIALQPGNPDIKNGQYVLQSHGRLIKTLTEQEYHHYRANEVRGFSGHWMAFYGIAIAILYPYKSQTEKLSNDV